MEEVIKKVTQILDQFLQEEYGNKLSQFAVFALKSMILSEIKKLEEKNNGTNPG